MATNTDDKTNTPTLTAGLQKGEEDDGDGDIKEQAQERFSPEEEAASTLVVLINWHNATTRYVRPSPS